MGTKLWGSSIVGERNDGQIVNHKKKRRVNKSKFFAPFFKNRKCIFENVEILLSKKCP